LREHRGHRLLVTFFLDSSEESLELFFLVVSPDYQNVVSQAVNLVFLQELNEFHGTDLEQELVKDYP
jgi:hypothetical protein